MKDLLNPHDRCFQQLMQQPENALAFFQRYLEPQWQKIIDLDTLELQSGSSVTSKQQKLHTDILYQAKFFDPETQGKTAYLYTIIEHQSTPDPAMALRLLQYKASLLLRHLKDDQLPPIHTMLFYHGSRSPYPYNLDLRTCFGTREQAEHTLQGPPQLIDVQEYSDAILLRNDRAGLFSYFFKHVRDEDILPALTALPATQLRKIAQTTSGLLLIKTLLGYYQIQAKTQKPQQAFQQVAGKLEPQQQENIMYMGEALIAQGLEQGIEQGKKENMNQVAANMLHEGMDPRLIQKITGLSLEEIQNCHT